MRLPLKQSKDQKYNAAETYRCTEYTALILTLEKAGTEGEFNHLLCHSSRLTSNRLSSNPFPPRGMASQGAFSPSPLLM